MDKNVMDELMNRGIVTIVGLDADKITDVEDLVNRGFATSVDTEDVYNQIVDNSETTTPDTEVEEPNVDTPAGDGPTGEAPKFDEDIIVDEGE